MRAADISDPLGAPPPGILLGTKTLLTIVERQADPDAAADYAAKEIQREVIVLRHQSDFNDPTEVARAMHKRVDKTIVIQDANDPSASEVKCTRGCNACCYQHVTLSEPEAKLAFEAAYKADHDLDMKRLARQAWAGEAGYQDRLSKEERRCVMLKDDGDCAIYEARPTACRAYRVVTDPALCDTEGNPHGRIAALANPGAEMIVSAAMRSFRYGGLAAFMLELGWPSRRQA